MRRSFILCLTFSVLACTACSNDESPATADPSASGSALATATAEVPAGQAAVVAAHHGGSLVALGHYHVELKLFKNGDVEAWVLDAQGKSLAQPQAVTMTVVQKGEPEAKVALRWSEPMARFTGSTDAKLTTAAVRVELEVGGKAEAGELADVVLLVGPEFGGVMMVAGKYGVEVAADADGSLEAAVKAAGGAAVTGGLALAAKVHAEGDTTHTIKLVYDASLARFRGKAQAGVNLVAGPIAFLIGGKVSGQLPSLALRAKATHGGRLVMVGDYSVELVAEGDHVSAFVADANAAAHAKGDLNLQLEAGAGELIALEWHAPSACYRAKLAADLDLNAQPIRVFLRSGGALAVGGIASAKVVAKASARLNAPSAQVKAQGTGKAKASLPAPRVDVKTSASKSGKVGGKAGISIGIK